MLRIKEVNELPREEDGFRILIDETWPEGLSKEEARVDLWLKEITTKGLDEWPQRKPINSEKIENKYNPEYQKKNRIIKIIRATEKEKGTVTFLYSTIKSIKQLQF